MNRSEFLGELEKRISSLPEDDIRRLLEYYAEMIDDRVEEGLSQEDAVAGLGSMDEIVSQILSDVSLSKIIKQKARREHRLKAWEIVLIVLGSPIWLSLIVAVAAVIFSLYAIIWSLVVSLCATFGALAGASLGVLILTVAFFCNGRLLGGVAMLGACMILTGITVLWFFLCRISLRGVVLLTKKIALGIKYCVTGGGK